MRNKREMYQQILDQIFNAGCRLRRLFAAGCQLDQCGQKVSALLHILQCLL